MSNKPNVASETALPGRIVVIDDDTTVKNALSRVLFADGVADILSFTDAEEGWAHLESVGCDLLVLDWKMDGTNGAQVLNRCRASTALQDLPILIVSGYLTKKDFRLADEFFLLGLCEKPIAAKTVTLAVAQLWQEHLWLTKQRQAVEKAIVELLQSGKRSIAPLLGQLSMAPKPLPVCLAAIRALVSNGVLDKAEDLCQWLIDEEPESPVALTAMGKILIQRHRFAGAISVLERARSVSPDSPERLCLMGDASLQMFDTESASKFFDEARALDPGWRRTQNGQALAHNVANWLSQSDLSKAPESFAGMLNAIGISLVRTGEFAHGVSHYESAMEYVSQAFVQAQLAFNVGLGYERWNKPEQAADWFAKSNSLARGKFEKPLAHLERLKSMGFVPAPNAGQTETTRASAAADVAAEAERGMPIGQKANATAKSAAELPDIQEERMNDDLVVSIERQKQGGAEAVAGAGAKTEKAEVHGEAQQPKTKTPLMAKKPLSLKQVQAFLTRMRGPDQSLFLVAEREDLKMKYDAYTVEISGQKGICFIPKPFKPADMVQKDKLEILESDTIILTREKGMGWRQAWPAKARPLAAA